MKYAIQFIGYDQSVLNDFVLWEYFTGGQYSHTGELFAISDQDHSKAKMYSSKKRAENAVKSMYGKFANVANARIVPVDQINS